ncbi:MAG: hypothetical protein HZB33_14650, partial [Nitrospirae bacterium]|nr:hypothetical protein [Nitrospirota bacterium]
QTDQGAQSAVPVLNQNDSGRRLPAQETGQGKFLVEGLKEGTHRVDIDITGTLLGLPTGPITVKGRAQGTVLVRNPNFSLAFGHPDIVRDGEEYSLYVTVNNTSQVDANLVTLNLFPNDIYGATMIADSDPSTPLGIVKFRTIKPGDSAVAEYKFIARRTGRVTSTAHSGV